MTAMQLTRLQVVSGRSSDEDARCHARPNLGNAAPDAGAGSFSKQFEGIEVYIDI